MKRKEIIQQAVSNIDPTQYLDYREYLKALYIAVKNRVIKYSYIKFAQDLGYAATTVIHQIVTYKRPLSYKAGLKIIKALGITGKNRQYLITLIEYNNSKNSVVRDKCFQALLRLKNKTLVLDIEKDRLGYFSEWYHPVIKEMVSMDGFQPDPEWIAKTIVPNIRPEQVKNSLALLERLGLICFDPDKNNYKPEVKNVVTPHDVEGMAMVGYHQKVIEIAKEAITNIAGDKRDISSLTIRFSEENVNHIKRIIEKFHNDILEIENKFEQGNQIYQVNIQLFPFSKKVIPGGDDV